MALRQLRQGKREDLLSQLLQAAATSGVAGESFSSEQVAKALGMMGGPNSHEYCKTKRPA